MLAHVDGAMNVRCSEGLSNLDACHLAKSTADAVRTGARHFLSFLRRYRPTATEEDLTNWRTQADFDRDIQARLRDLQVAFHQSKSEANVWLLEETSIASAIVTELCGIYHLLDGMVAAGLLATNFMAVPRSERVTRRIAAPTAFGGSAPTIETKFRYRLPPITARPLRTDSGEDYPYILPALEDFGAPTAIILQTRIAIDACGRLHQRIDRSILDYWEGSEFDDVILLPNKGAGNERPLLGVLSDATAGAFREFGEGERATLDTRGWTLSQWEEYLIDPKVPRAVSRAAAAAEPLLPTRKGIFISKSGYRDVWYAPAMNKAGLTTRTHYTRHIGVHLFLDWVDGLTDLTEIERNNLRISFARSIGWAWPEMMLAIYSLPQRQSAMLEAARMWKVGRAGLEERIMRGEFGPATHQAIHTEARLASVARRSLEKLGVAA